ncbi:PAAR domain-containing protein [Cupriavidus sp. SW-Y-13]|uniref:PAAR domain-containing protein n=1 Tax=Cupriavidus sp. SW-Y-13 TaxID=2653854 RepID=UPI001365B779|nr:PAAR domain-containing protein [Cupriavidus sp. SW-Y-13]MWL90369.1 PAAR domain-containing protein [Cupriavidus sp. SW-Y-13]
MTENIICQGDSTDHGGVVLEGFSNTDLDGRKIAGRGHMVSCPKCRGVFPIVEGNQQYTVDETPVALHGMKTACGAILIAGRMSAEVGS